MSTGTLHDDLILIRRHYANFRKEVMMDEALCFRDTRRRKMVVADRDELDALCRCIKRLEADRWQGRKKQ
jgi:hypothetical protein